MKSSPVPVFGPFRSHGLAAVVIVLLVAGACSDDTADTVEGAATSSTITSSTTTTAAPATTEAPTTTTAAPAAPVASAGCGGDAAAPGIETFTLATADGLTRTYRRFVPASYEPDEPTPVVLNFHGYTGSPEAQVGLSLLEPVGEAEGFVVVHPQGTVAESLGETFWNTEPGAPHTAPGYLSSTGGSSPAISFSRRSIQYCR